MKLRHAYKVVKNTKEDVAKMLMDLSVLDWDFNGENGSEYLWDCAWEYENNAEYTLSVAEEEETPEQMIKTFIDMWMSHDAYYLDYKVGIVIQDDNLFMTLAYITD